MGVVTINIAFLDTGTMDKFYQIPVFIHEVFHILGFSNGVFNGLNMSTDVMINGVSHKAINSTGVVTYAKTFFNCNTLGWVPLENAGGSGSASSHFEKTLFPNEVMNPQIVSPMVISEFTIKVFEDMTDPSTGYKFYLANTAYNPAQHYTGNKNAGCSVVTSLTTDNTRKEYCTTANTRECWTNPISKGYCYQGSTFTGTTIFLSGSKNNYCPIDNPNKNEF
jgi:leishmanolysin